MTLADALLAARLRSQDRRDAALFGVYARMQLTPHARMMVLSGLAGFERSLKGETT